MTKSKKHKHEEEVKPQEQAVEAEVSEEAKAELTLEEQLQAERDDLFARLQRTAADYANYQKRVQRDISETRDFANTNLIKELLPVLDDMERALDAAKGSAEDDPLRQGMQLVHDKALEILGKFGLERIEAAGGEFDPEKHQAILHQPTDEHPPHVVMHEVQRGYQLKGRTIRPSSVVVSKEPEQPADAEESASEESSNQE